jgi:hypothetical protein
MLSKLPERQGESRQSRARQPIDKRRPLCDVLIPAMEFAL